MPVFERSSTGGSSPGQLSVGSAARASEALSATLDEGARPLLPADVQVTQRLGRYILLRQLGAGGMGSVFAAYDEQLDRKVALKLLHQQATAMDEQRQRVLREAQAMARVSHPNVVHVYEVGEVSGRIFISMEYIDGQALSAWQSAQPRTWQEIVNLYRQAGEGLLAAHQNGLVHRDFKADNVLVDGAGRVRVVDFGLARRQDAARSEAAAVISALPASGAAAGPGEKSLTVAGAISGTPGYMSPEQYRGQDIDSRSDQFSFCAALYEALFQQLPFAGDGVVEQAASVLSGKLRPPPSSSPVPEAIKDALLRGLSSDAAERFPSMSELLTALEGEAEPDPAVAQAARRRASALILGCCVVIIGAILLKYSRSGLTVANLAIVATSVLMLTLGSAVGFRRSLTAHSFHRRFFSMKLIIVGSWFAIRCLAIPLHLEVKQLLPLEMMVLSGLYALMAYQYLPGLWWLAGSWFLGSVVSTLRPQNLEQTFMILYSAWGPFVLYAWDSASRRRKARERMGSTGQKQKQSGPSGESASR